MEGIVCNAVSPKGEKMSVVQLDGVVFNLSDGSIPDLRGWKLIPTVLNILNLKPEEASLLTFGWSDSARAASARARSGKSSSSLSADTKNVFKISGMDKKAYSALSPGKREAVLKNFLSSYKEYY